MSQRTTEIRTLIKQGALLTGPVRVRNLREQPRVRTALALPKRDA